MPHPHSPRLIGVLYLGGTIGCAGSPLAPLAAEIFLPRLEEILATHIQTQGVPTTWRCIAGTIKDSSALIPEDWADLIGTVLAPERADIRHWIILHGTDTLAYSAAFLAAALTGVNRRVVISGSQLPLLDPQSLVVNRDSDALVNLQTSYDAFSDASASSWVAVAFNQQVWLADSVQKIHSQNRQAFTGLTPLLHPHDASFSAPLPPHRSDTPPHPILADLGMLKQRLASLNIQLYYASPLPRDVQVAQLTQLLESGAEAVIVLAYGLGNLPKDPRLVTALLAAEQRGVMVILSSQVPFGGVESRYAAGNWLKQSGVLSAETLPLPAIFARLAWLHVTQSRYSDRRKAWLQGTMD